MTKKRCILGELMKQRNLTQTKLSEMSGVPQTVISRYVRGSTQYSIDYLFQLKKALALASIEELFEDQ